MIFSVIFWPSSLKANLGMPHLAHCFNIFCCLANCCSFCCSLITESENDSSVVWTTMFEDCLSVTPRLREAHFAICTSHFFPLMIWRSGGVTGLVAHLTSMWLIPYGFHSYLNSPSECTSRGLILLGLGAMCLLLFKGRANRSLNWDGSHLTAERRSAGWVEQQWRR